MSLWTNYTIFLSLHFLICEMGVMLVPPSQGLWLLTEMTHVKHLAWNMVMAL